MPTIVDLIFAGLEHAQAMHFIAIDANPEPESFDAWACFWRSRASTPSLSGETV